MNKISCDICNDLIPLVKDEVASEGSKKAVFEHIKTCSECKKNYGIETVFEESDSKILKKIRKKLFSIALIIIVLGMLFGISLAENQFMFYNILIMPTIGAVSYFTLKEKSWFVCLGVFVLVYFKWFGFMIEDFEFSQIINAFIGPLWWSTIYVSLVILGMLIAFLLKFGLTKEKHNEKNT